MDRFGLSAVDYGGTVVGGITALDAASQTELSGEASSGELYPRIQAVRGQAPRATFSTLAINAALDAFAGAVLGLFAAPITTTGSKTLSLYLAKHTEGGGRESGSVHRKYLVNKGILYPRQLTCQHQGDATLDYEALCIYDGTNAPIVPSLASLPSTPTSDALRFSLGPVKIGNVTLSAYRSLTIDFGVEARAEGAESAVWPTHSSVVRIAPRLTIAGIDPTWFAASGAVALDGLAATHANTLIYLRKRLAGGTFVTNVTAEHISITACGIAYPEKLFEVTDGPAGVTLSMPLYYDGTNLPLIVDTTAAIV